MCAYSSLNIFLLVFAFVFVLLGSCIMCCVVSFCFKMHKESDFDEMAAWLDEKVSTANKIFR